jgi:hypothetical protein
MYRAKHSTKKESFKKKKNYKPSLSTEMYWKYSLFKAKECFQRVFYSIDFQIGWRSLLTEFVFICFVFLVSGQEDEQ